MNIRQKLTLGIAAIFMVTLTIVGVTYAYFVTRVTGDLDTESVNVQTATVGDIVYKDINGPVEFSSVLPGTTRYYHFSVANLGEQQQPFELFLTEARAKTGYTPGTVKIGDTTYTYGEFIHSATGKDTDTGVTTDVTGCYGTNNKMSAELTTSTEDAAYKTLCFTSLEESEDTKYNNFKITLYKLADTTPKDVTGETGNKSFNLTNDVFAGINYSSALIDSGDGKNLITTPTQINYVSETGLVASIDIPGNTVYSYVLKVEYLKNELVQNTENLASLKLQVDIRA